MVHRIRSWLMHFSVFKGTKYADTSTQIENATDIESAINKTRKKYRLDRNSIYHVERVP